jgi:hypothetical protein
MMRKEKRTRYPTRRRGWWSLLLVVSMVCGAGGVATGLLIIKVEPPGALAAGMDVTNVAATVQQFDDERPVVVTFWSKPDVPLIVRAMGVVTRLPESSVINSGKATVWVDGKPIVALATKEPLYRTLGVGDKGSDVHGLNIELARLGYPAPDSGEFTVDTRDAWIEVQKAAHVAIPSWSLELDSVVWLPAASVSVDAWWISLGSSTPSDGVVASIPGSVLNAEVVLTDNGDPPTGPLVLSVLGVSITIDKLGTITESGFLTNVSDTPRFEGIAQETDGSRQAPGTIRMAEPIAVLGVPPAAVFGLLGSDGCVQVGDAGVPVRVVGSSLGVSLVQTRDGSTPDRVMVGAGITKTSC